MATEARPSTAIISTTNLVASAAASVGNASAAQRYYPASMLLSQLRGEPWRTPAILTAASVDIDLGAAFTPGAAGGIRVFALVNYNGYPASSITLQSITGIGGSVVSTWTFTGYNVARVNRMLVFFVGNHDGGVAGAASRYWRIGLPVAFGIGGDYPNSVDTFTQVGNVWLGDWTEIGYDKGARIRLVDPSIETKSRSGAAYHDKLWPYHEVDLKVPLVHASILYPTLKEQLDVAGGTTRLLLHMHAAQTEDYWRAHGAYYGRLDLKGGSEQTLSFSLYGDLKLSFVEDPS